MMSSQRPICDSVIFVKVTIFKATWICNGSIYKITGHNGDILDKIYLVHIVPNGNRLFIFSKEAD